MRFPFGRNPRRQELDDVRRRIAQLRTEIDQLEEVARSADEDSDTPDAYRSVQRLRESMTRDELQGKRVELEQLETRERELVAAEAVPPEPTAAAIPVAEPLSRELSAASMRYSPVGIPSNA